MLSKAVFIVVSPAEPIIAVALPSLNHSTFTLAVYAASVHDRVIAVPSTFLVNEGLDEKPGNVLVSFWEF